MKDCWQAGGGGRGRGGKGQDAKGVSSLDEDLEPEAEEVETGFLSLAGLETVKEETEDHDEEYEMVDKRRREGRQPCIAKQEASRGARSSSRRTWLGMQSSTMPVKEEEYEDDTAGGMETEAVSAVDDKTVRIHTGQARQVSASAIKSEEKGNLFEFKKKYRRLTQDEVEKFKTETKGDELQVIRKKRVNIFAGRVRKMDKQKKDKRRTRVKGARRRQRKAETEAFYLNHPKDALRCEKFVKNFCRKGLECPMIHSEVDREKYHIDARYEKVGKDMSRVRLIPNEASRAEINSFGADEIGPQEWTHIVANFDTGAAVTAIPSVLKQKLGLAASETVTRNYKTASGELLADEGGTVLNGYDNDGQGRSVTGRLVNVHRMLVSGSAVGRKNCVMLDGSTGTIIPNNGPIADGMRRSLKQLIQRHPKDAKRLTNMYEQGGIYCFDLWLH